MRGMGDFEIQEKSGRIGFMLSPEHTVKLIQIANYMQKSEYEVILFHIDYLYETIMRSQSGGKNV